MAAGASGRWEARAGDDSEGRGAAHTEEDGYFIDAHCLVHGRQGAAPFSGRNHRRDLRTMAGTMAARVYSRRSEAYDLLLCKQGVVGSIPISSTQFRHYMSAHRPSCGFLGPVCGDQPSR